MNVTYIAVQKQNENLTGPLVLLGYWCTCETGWCYYHTGGGP